MKARRVYWDSPAKVRTLRPRTPTFGYSPLYVPRRILHISTRLILGGSQENTVLSCEGQSALGHDVHLAFGPIYGPEGSLLDRVTHYRSPHKLSLIHI